MVAGMTDSLLVTEIYLSLQGESTFAGLPCIFARLTGCNLRCSYCDTAYAFTGGTKMPLEAVIGRIHQLAAAYHPTPGARHRLPLVELTGGEPLAQGASRPLMTRLIDAGYTVLLETSGAWSLADVDERVRKIMDLKCPSSGEWARNKLENIPLLKPWDEIKFVIGTEEDYAWAKAMIRDHALAARCELLFSWVSPLLDHQRDKSLKPFPADHHPISRRDLVERIVEDALPARFQLQMHKFVWPPDQKGV